MLCLVTYILKYLKFIHQFNIAKHLFNLKKSCIFSQLANFLGLQKQFDYFHLKLFKQIPQHTFIRRIQEKHLKQSFLSKLLSEEWDPLTVAQCFCLKLDLEMGQSENSSKIKNVVKSLPTSKNCFLMICNMIIYIVSIFFINFVL